MKKAILLSIVAVFALAGSAFALPYLDVIASNPSLMTFGQTQSFDFRLNSDVLSVGDVNVGDTINTATLTLNFADDSGEGDGGLFGWKDEYALVDWEVGPYSFEVDTGAWTANVLSEVIGDHRVRVSVTNTSLLGDFYLGNASVGGDYTPASAPVPEPATLSLLGLGVLGLLKTRKRA